MHLGAFFPQDVGRAVTLNEVLSCINFDYSYYHLEKLVLLIRKQKIRSNGTCSKFHRGKGKTRSREYI